MPKTYKPPTERAAFESKTALLVELVAETCLNQRGYQFIGGVVYPPDGKPAPTPEQWTYFVAHCEAWVRWFHANDAKWRAKLNKDGRDWTYLWVGHWSDAFIADPAGYIEKHPMDTVA